MGAKFAHLLDSLGWAVIHALWQGAVAFLVVAVFRAVLGARLPALRYSFQFTVMIGCLIAFLWTFSLYFGNPALSLEGGATLSENPQLADPTLLTQFIAPFDASAIAAQGGASLSRFTPVLASLWVLGFAGLSLRYAFAFGQVQQLRRIGLTSPSPVWQSTFDHLLSQSGLAQNVKLFISANVSGPVTLGLFKPVVLVPAGFLCGLPADEVEAILLHELAHIRRYDYALNLVQTAVKTALFFHPAIYIISRWTDQDREQACDDFAVAQACDPKALMRGLAALRLNTQPQAFAMAADGGDTPLMIRLKRLVGSVEHQNRPGHILMPLIAAILIGGAYLSTTSAANAHPEPTKSERATSDKRNYKFETQRINGRNVTVKVTGDGRRWVLVDGEWVDIDKNSKVLGRLSRAMPQPPHPPQLPSLKNGKFALSGL